MWPLEAKQESRGPMGPSERAPESRLPEPAYRALVETHGKCPLIPATQPHSLSLVPHSQGHGDQPWHRDTMSPSYLSTACRRPNSRRTPLYFLKTETIRVVATVTCV